MCDRSKMRTSPVSPRVKSPNLRTQSMEDIKSFKCKDSQIRTRVAFGSTISMSPSYRTRSTEDMQCKYMSPRTARGAFSRSPTPRTRSVENIDNNDATRRSFSRSPNSRTHSVENIENNIAQTRTPGMRSSRSPTPRTLSVENTKNNDAVTRTPRRSFSRSPVPRTLSVENTASNDVRTKSGMASSKSPSPRTRNIEDTQCEGMQTRSPRLELGSTTCTPPSCKTCSTEDFDSEDKQTKATRVPLSRSPNLSIEDIPRKDVQTRSPRVAFGSTISRSPSPGTPSMDNIENNHPQTRAPGVPLSRSPSSRTRSIEDIQYKDMQTRMPRVPLCRSPSLRTQSIEDMRYQGVKTKTSGVPLSRSPSLRTRSTEDIQCQVMQTRTPRKAPGSTTSMSPNPKTRSIDSMQYIDVQTRSPRMTPGSITRMSPNPRTPSMENVQYKDVQTRSSTVAFGSTLKSPRPRTPGMENVHYNDVQTRSPTVAPSTTSMSASKAVSMKRQARDTRWTGLPLRERLYNCVQSGPLSNKVLRHLTVSVNGLEVLCLMVDRMGEEFKPHISTVLPSVIDRLGDAKDQVREQAQQLLLKLMMPASSPQYVFERMSGAFSHKLWHVREGMLVCLQNTINRYGARSLQLSKTVPAICKLLEDQNSQVREAAVVTLTEIYRHVGEKVRHDLSRKGIAPQKLSQIFARFDDVKASGNMLPTADMAPSRGGGGEDEVDYGRPVSYKTPTSSKKTSLPTSASRTKGLPSRPGSSSSSVAGAGAVDEELFVKSFEDVPKVKFFSSRDIMDQMSKVNAVLSDANQDWEKRVDNLKTFRALVMNGATDHDEFHQQLRGMEPAFVSGVKDLRSQVVREACITIAYMAQQLGNKLDRFAEVVFPALFNLIPNSAKIMATSGCVCIRFIIQYVHTNRLIPIVTGNMASKSSVIRRQSCEFLNQLLHSWATHTLEKHIALLQDSIRRGISDADSEARVFARKAFWGFAEHFKSQADALLGSLDPSKQKLLQGELSNSSSNNSLNSSEGLHPGKLRTRSASQDRSIPKYTGTLERTGSVRKTGPSRMGSSSRSDTGSASSRSTSPSSRGSYLSHTQHASGRDHMTPKGRRKSGIPRSQGTSRETSPNRHGYGRERRASGSKIPSFQSGHSTMSHMSHRVLRPGSDVEDALHDALARSQRKRYETYDSDDAASEASSVCSERSYSSYSGRTSEDMTEIIALLGSGSYTDRKDGLFSLQHLLRSSRYLSRVELKKVTEVFTRMFHDPHSKVLSIFLDTLSELCMSHARELSDWLYILLTRLLNKTGSDMVGSLHAKLLRTMDTVREVFPCDSQFNTITKFIIDQTQSPNLKVKISMLNYQHALVGVMEPSDFVNTMDTRLAVSRIINWTMEPRNVDVRKTAQLVLIGLFNLNPPEFSLMLAALPKAFQDGATKILHTHMRSASETSDVLSPHNAASPTTPQQRSRPPSRQSVGQAEECETENMNPEDIYNSIKKTSADIQSLSLGSKLEGGYEEIKKKREFASQDSGIQELRNDSPDGVESRRGNLHLFHPHHAHDEQSGVNGYNKMVLTEDSDTASCDKETTIPDVLRELSNHNERVKERCRMLEKLLKWVRHSAISEDQWDEHFKSILLILIETFGDTDKTMRMDAMVVFRSILKRHSARFRDYAELTILKVCEAHRDPSKDVQRAAEECALVIPTSISPDQALPILNNIIATARFPVHWAAIKMLAEVVKLVPTELLHRALPNTVPGLLMGYDDSDSRVRKASVFSIVNIYLRIGEGLRPYLMDLNSSKTKLLNLYIKRSQDDSKSGGILSPAASDL